MDLSHGYDLELQHILGYILDLGKRKGCRMPVCEFVNVAVQLKLELVRGGKVLGIDGGGNAAT